LGQPRRCLKLGSKAHRDLWRAPDMPTDRRPVEEQ
jgi:hypothetical protein